MDRLLLLLLAVIIMIVPTLTPAEHSPAASHEISQDPQDMTAKVITQAAVFDTSRSVP